MLTEAEKRQHDEHVGRVANAAEDIVAKEGGIDGGEDNCASELALVDPIVVRVVDVAHCVS